MVACPPLAEDGEAKSLKIKQNKNKLNRSIFLAGKMQELHRVPCVTCLCAPLADEGDHSAGGGCPPARDHQ